MEIRCPQCQNPLTIEDQYAGQLMRCPTCNGTFQAPVLGPVSNQGWVAPAPEPTAPAPEPVATEVAAERPKKKKQTETRPAPPPAASGEYVRSYTLSMTGRKLLPWIPPIGLSLILLLSFFPWAWLPGAHLTPGTPGAPPPTVDARANMWQIAFGREPKGVMTMFVILAIFLAWPLSILALAISLKLIPLPAPLDVIASFRSIIVGALALLGFVFFTIVYLEFLFADYNPATLAMKLAFRIALVVAAAAVLQFWLDRRQIKNLPPPQVSVRW